MNTVDMAAYAEYVANPIVRSTAPRGAGLVVSMGHVWEGGVIVFSGNTAECKAQYLALRYPVRKAEVVAPIHEAHVHAWIAYWEEDEDTDDEWAFEGAYETAEEALLELRYDCVDVLGHFEGLAYWETSFESTCVKVAA
jgi:hypothetical protein